ncbi:SRPBCC domain-containing protein [Pendulispora albinea]|uniref:SRPBCC domain-containing protein n=1 Tax=Pendulispora albinea TaxID=2741071 RepID=A0ABZ2M925_9BACT
MSSASYPKAPQDLFGLTVSRRIQAPPEAVFAAWTDPEKFRKWFDTTQLVLEAEPGKLYFLEVAYDNKLWAHYGRYLRVERPRLVEFTWMSEGTEGKESIVKVELTPIGEATDLRIVHSGLPTEKWRKSHLDGWTDIAAAIAAFVEPK